jgi:Protein of unknown function (DUF2721)
MKNDPFLTCELAILELSSWIGSGPRFTIFHLPFTIGQHMDSMSSAIAVLTAMITPAVLISACGSMILSTSGRLGRVVDRVRALSDRLEEMTEKPGATDVARERQAVIFSQLDKLTSRARILQRSMVTFYIALGLFVATSVAIGVVGIAGNPRYNVVPVIVGMLGACFLFYGSMLLIFEARLALSTIHAEMDFIWRQTTRVAPADLVENHKPHFVHFRRHHSTKG